MPGSRLVIALVALCALAGATSPQGQQANLYPPYNYSLGLTPFNPSDGRVSHLLSGLPYAAGNSSKQPWNVQPGPAVPSPNVAAASCTPLTPTNPAPSDYWYANVVHNGQSPFINNGASYKVFRNVVSDYGADNTGKNDASAAIQKAIYDGSSSGQSRQKDPLGTTGQPAVIYFPPGVYKLQNPIQMVINTVLIGNPISMPILKASSTWTSSNGYMVHGYDSNTHPTTNFYIAIKNLQFDSTAVNKAQTFTLLDWSVSQATELSNLVFNMPLYSTGHVGIATPSGGSPTEMGDVTFQGGNIGLLLSGYLQQGHYKSLKFTNCTTGIKVNQCYSCVFANNQFTNGAVGIDITSSPIGSIVLLDSTANAIGTVVKTNAESTGDHTLIIENYSGTSVGSVVSASGNTILNANVPNTWVYGNAYTRNGPATGSHQTGTTYTTTRPSSLLQNGKFVAIAPPTHAGYSASQVQNVKTVPNLPVHGDGSTDDTVNLNKIISMYAGCKILFFPAGTYIVTNTLFFPVGSRVVGEAWSAISATGSNYYNPSAPNVMVRVGNPGDVGVAQFTDMLFTVADVLQGCTLLEVNMAGSAPGAVGFWNTHFRIGGARGSKVETSCAPYGNPSACKAAFMLAHLTPSSSAYIENMWGWTADHDLDGLSGQPAISTGRGILIESTRGTWLQGTGFEHNTLYQYNINNAKNVYLGMHQTETAYWQGPGTNDPAPAPWTPLSNYGDPTFSNCAGTNDAKCTMGWGTRISGSNNIFLYGSAFWNFFNDFDQSCQSSYCQTNAAEVLNTTGLNWFGINTHSMLNVETNNGQVLVTQNNNPGSWGACVGAFLVDL